ncbi:hypothetical protein J5Y06_17830 [Tianweitania sediminis]|uniref:Hydantoinase/oxoprolinase N-terminal domain-containing protein n=1 Tax=Tianweitania sediminis TaxID=1502156 RepID=A0A8J7R0V5_9HYPH|nr:hydantoinase/oxoprolinase N-terminal domain-containing protein [Tianweitania sediminis]MBP0440513.1 hypothetical protein [Tianweitania sediminis]
MPDPSAAPLFSGPLFLGIDTGGTYTDAVLWTPEGGNKGTVIAKAKALTTRHDLAEGIAGAAGIDMPFETQVMLVHDQTDEDDGIRGKQREGWPKKRGADAPRPVRHLRGEDAAKS